MNGIFDKFNAVSGSVVPYFMDMNGKISIIPSKHNTVLLSSRGILANLMAGKSNYKPSHIGFVVNSNLTNSTISTSYGMSELLAGASSSAAISYAGLLEPTVRANTVTFTTHTGLIYNNNSGVVERMLTGTVNRANLVCATGADGYQPFSAVDFDGIVIPESSYFGLYWTITFGDKSEET